MLVDTRNMAVKAVVGSADFFNEKIEGQVNGTQAKRSPGSTLKPFIYALGIDQGVLHPHTMVKDAQLAFGAYSPENFDGRFAGPLPAKEALVRSRNVPALWVASKLSNPSLYEFLRTAGISRLKSESHYGLALVLGGAEVTMEELATLYAALPNRGLLRPLRYLKSDPQVPGVRVLSDEASFVTLDMLKDNPRPENNLASQSLLNVLPVAWKTGTSYGFRDAWTAGVVGPYVLVVWIGNFNGEGNPAFVGVTAAAPLFFAIVDALAAQQHGLLPPPRPLPHNLSRVPVCAVSGQLPSRYCPQKQMTWFVPGRSPIEVCQLHRPVDIDDRTGRRACPGSAGRTHTEVFEFWPSDLLRLFRAAGLPRRTPPPPMPGCSLTAASATGVPPKITSPLRGVIYTLRPGIDQHDSIALSATTDADAQEVFWFVNESFVGKARSGTAFMWQPSPGHYTVRAVDDLGRADAREVEVQTSR
jgi:penicillin-binding protein 1C